MIYTWLPPWYPIDSEEDCRALCNELQREINSAHPLHGLMATAIARRQDNDDVLFVLEDGRYAAVHLTWVGQQDSSDVPATTVYATAEDFARDRMMPDHHE